jgi:hypothetical protein
MIRRKSSFPGPALAWAGLLLIAAAAPRAAQGHSLLVTPQPRDQQDGYKDPPRTPPGTGAPCGIGRMVPPQPETSYSPGQALHVTWSETVTHPGCFVIDFAEANDANFQILGVKSHAGAVGNNPRPWSLDVTLPSTTCATCTLRLRQLMLPQDVPDSQCPPATIPSGDTYYSCANITLGGGSSGGTGGDSGGGTSDSGGGGSGCALGGARASFRALALALLALVARRRRRT